jgi:hypothetical protein
MNYRHHPQTIRAKELARAAGADPDQLIRDEIRQHRAWKDFRDGAFDEIFEREAIDGIWWDRGGSAYTTRWETPRRDGECFFLYSRRKSGSRWFWYVYGWEWGPRKTGVEYLDHGWSDTEQKALLDGTAAIKRLAAGRRVIAHISHGLASHKLKEIKAKRAAKPASSAKESSAAEDGREWKEFPEVLRP